MFGWSTEQLVGRSVFELHPETERARIRALAAELLSHGEAHWPMSPIINRSGGPAAADITLRSADWDGIGLVFAYLRDVTALEEERAALRQTERQLGDSEARHAALVQAADDAILVADFDSGLFIEANDAARTLFGYTIEEFRRRTGKMLHPESAWPDIDRASAELKSSGRARLSSTPALRKGGSVFFADLQVATYFLEGTRLLVAFIRDVSERQAREEELAASYRRLQDAQAQLVQASKMSAMGQLGAGIAHELNQPITVIQGFAKRIRRRSHTPVGAFDRDLDIIIRETGRMARLVDNVRTFGRQDPFNAAPISALEPIQDALMLLRAQLVKRGILVLVEADENLPLVMADRVKLQQVFINFLGNARDALVCSPPQGEPATIRILVQREQHEPCVSYAVRDNGPGVDPEHVQKLFDPFFTTKAPGEGTGLGLSIAYSLVAEHGGRASYQESPGGGASFEITIPAVVADEERA